MTLPKVSLRPVLSWIASQFGALLVAIVCAGAVALAATKFVTHDVLAEKAVDPITKEAELNRTQAEAITVIAAKADGLEKRDAANAAADDKRDAAIRSLLETTQNLAAEVRANSDKTRAQEAQIIALQTVTAGIRTEIAVVQANQIAAAKQSDRIEDKLDRLIEGRAKSGK
jgi:hypothetical protein